MLLSLSLTHVIWPHPGKSPKTSYPSIRQSCIPTSFSKAVVNGLASVATLLGLYIIDAMSAWHGEGSFN